MAVTALVVPEEWLADGVAVCPREEVHAGALVLVRPTADAAGGLAAARGVGAPLAALPVDDELARWMVHQVARWLADGEEELERAAMGLSSLLPPGPEMPTRPWGDCGVRVPAVPRRMLARLCRVLWRPCGACDGGGVPGRACGRCVRPLERAE